ncbi:MAG: hypothetical protein K2I71_06575, partial [Helicobacter sp.]|nr:hypothetical protein [Helicobacter sp.]
MRYIYPKGVSGEQLGVMMEELDNYKPIFIDDSKEETSFEALKEDIIANNAMVYVALSKLNPSYEENLSSIVAKLQRHQIPYILDGLEEYVRRSILKVQKEIVDKQWRGVFYLVMPDFAKDKHFGFLDDAIIQQGGKVVYICTQRDSYARVLAKRDKENSKVLYFSYEFLFLIDFPCVMCVTGNYNFHKNTQVIFIGHSINDYNQTDLSSLKDYKVCVAGKQFMPKNNAYNIEFLKCGYLGYDLVYQELKSKERKLERKSVLIAPYDLEELAAMKLYIKSILEKYPVILRYRYEWGKDHIPFIESFLEDENFSIDNSNPMDSSSYIKAFCLVCGMTTSKYSFPLISLSPCMVLLNIANRTNYKINENLGVNIT